MTHDAGSPPGTSSNDPPPLTAEEKSATEAFIRGLGEGGEARVAAAYRRAVALYGRDEALKLDDTISRPEDFARLERKIVLDERSRFVREEQARLGRPLTAQEVEKAELRYYMNTDEYLRGDRHVVRGIEVAFRMTNPPRRR